MILQCISMNVYYNCADIYELWKIYNFVLKSIKLSSNATIH